MRDEDRRREWEAFMEKYKEYLLTDVEIWKDTLEKLETFIDENGRRPNSNSKNDKYKKLGSFLSNQLENYKKRKYGMIDEDRRREWEAFTEKYKEYFLTDVEIWKDNLEKLETFIDENGRRPRTDIKNGKEKTSGKFLSHQLENYKKRKYGMKYEDRRREWEAFTEKYKEILSKTYKKEVNHSKKLEDQTMTYIKQKARELKIRGIYKYNAKNKHELIKRIRGITEPQIMNESLMTIVDSDDEGPFFIIESSDDEDSADQKIVDDEPYSPHLIFIESDDDDDEEDSESKVMCKHHWSTIREDSIRYKECKICGCKSQESNIATTNKYKESSTEKKLEINNFIKSQKYVKGNAIILDATEMKTSNMLSGIFTPDEITIPEYDSDTYNKNKKDETFGKCVQKGDFLTVLKTMNETKLSFIYADFTTRYETHVTPLFEYLKTCELKKGCIIGVTWSSNGAGTQADRDFKILHFGVSMRELGLECTQNYFYSNMNVYFMRKK